MENTRLKTTGLQPSATFISGDSYADQIGHYINCTDNPYDLRPAADIIVAAISERLASLPAGKPLVVEMGEEHKKPSHKELQHLVAFRLLKENKKFTFNFEQPHNVWAGIAKRDMNYDLESRLYYGSTSHDPRGQAILSAYMGFALSSMAPVSRNNQMAFLYHRGVSSAFNDAARDPSGHYFDLEDSLTRYFMEGNGWALSLTSPEGMAVRNQVMARRGLSHAEDQDLSLILQQAGFNHVFGNVQDGEHYAESLSSAYRDLGADVLPVFLTDSLDSTGINVFSPESYGALSDAVVIDGLAVDEFWGRSSGEKDFIQKLHKASGDELEFYDVAANEEFYQKQARQHAAAVLRSYKSSVACRR